MKTPLIALAGAALCVAVPATSQDIVVSAETAAIDAVSQDLDRALERAGSPRRHALGEGIAMVRFQRGVDGMPSNVKLYRSSGSARIDALATAAVSRLGHNAPLPAFAGPGQMFQANIVVANDEQEFADLTNRLAKLEKARLADPSERAVLALTAGTRKAS